MKRDKFLIIDGSGLMWRAIHRRGRSVRSPEGQDVSGVHSFCQLLFDLIREQRPEYCVLVTDAPRATTFRRKLDPGYKASRDDRDAVPKSVTRQLAWMKELTAALGICVLGAKGFEADDVIASLVDTCGSADVICTVATADHDMHQLVGKNCSVYDTMKDVLFIGSTVRRKWGVRANQIVDVMTLMGDPGDCVPGVPGIGPKTAVKAIQDHETLEQALDNSGEWANVKQQMALATTDLDLCRQLVALRKDVPLEVSATALSFDGFDLEEAEPALSALGLDIHY